MHLLYRSNNLWTPHGSPLVWAHQWPSSQPLSSLQFSHNDILWAWGITKNHREQNLDYRECEQLSWCPSWSNSLWQGWSCGLVHCPGGNATDPIWRVLVSSQGISSWTPLKHQHSNPNPIVQTFLPVTFWLFSKLRGCRYETIEEMKEAVTKVIDTLTQEDFHGAFQKLLEQYNKCIAAGGDYFEGD